jgi:predicted DNA-binding ribbon-helix-helix protein
MKSAIAKRSVVLHGRKTSVSLEPDFWEGIKDIARLQERAVADLVNEIDEKREIGNLSSAVRLFVLAHVKLHAASC